MLGDRIVRVHIVTAARAEPVSRSVPLDSFSEHPIAFLGGRVFAVFEDARLYRIDPATGGIDEALDDDTQLFSLTHDSDGEWDRDDVHIDSSGVLFPRAAIKDTFSHLAPAVNGSPSLVNRRPAC